MTDRKGLPMLEMELKFRVEDFTGIEGRLNDLGMDPGDPVAENNLILDLAGGPLRKMDTVFRLRSTGDGTLLTIKKPLPATCLKVRFEKETVLLCDISEAVDLFALLGYGVVYRYEKSRRECDLGYAKVCLDELWFGRFIEVEASSEEAVMKAVEALGLDSTLGIRFSYAALEQDALEEAERGADR